jgi:hypothetical protein
MKTVEINPILSKENYAAAVAVAAIPLQLQ